MGPGRQRIRAVVARKVRGVRPGNGDAADGERRVARVLQLNGFCFTGCPHFLLAKG